MPDPNDQFSAGSVESANCTLRAGHSVSAPPSTNGATPLRHVQTIRALIMTLMKSESFHALVVQSPPGWGKSTTIDQVLAELGIQAVSAGSYATPLHIYNTLCKHPQSVIVFDDCSGVFSDSRALAILKAATWSSGGTGGRQIAWGSASDKVEVPSADFSGKLILLTNVLPAGKEVDAFLSRCLSYRIQVGPREVREMLLDAARSEKHFADTAIAVEVAEFLVQSMDEANLLKVNLRTLRLGYDLAHTLDLGWRNLLLELIPRRVTATGPDCGVRPLISVQEKAFVEATGKSRRSFYYRRKRLGLSRPYVRSGDLT